MLKKEFLDLTHKTDDEVSDEDYQKYESLYMDLGGMSKEKFCKLLINDLPNLCMYAHAQIINQQTKNRLLEQDKRILAKGILNYEFANALRKVYELKDIIKMKLDNGLSLDEDEAKYVMEHLY